MKVLAKPDFVFECRSASVTLPLNGGARPIISDINLDVREAEFLSIVGPSGTGKTTLVRMLGGLLRPTAGEVRVKGEILNGPPEGVVIVFQDYANALLQWRTVAANVAFGIERKLSSRECAARVSAALDLVGLSKRADDYPWQLSGGMQQRVQIARALALRPAVMLMDEPFAALDAMTKAGLQDELLRLRDQTQTSFVFITHDIEEAVYLGDRVAVLKGSPGRIDEIVRVELPSPRDQISTRQMPEFLAYRYGLHKAIGHG